MLEYCPITPPRAPTLLRLSKATFTSSGKEIFSTRNEVSSRPSSENSAASFWLALPLSSSYIEASSNAGIRNSPSTSDNLETILASSCFSISEQLKSAREPTNRDSICSDSPTL